VQLQRVQQGVDGDQDCISAKQTRSPHGAARDDSSQRLHLEARDDSSQRLQSEAVAIPESAAAARAKGNAAYSVGDYKRAALNYTLALRVCAGDRQDGRSPSGKLRAFQGALFSNRSAAHACCGMWQLAMDDAAAALRLDDACAKYWCRRGAAEIRLSRPRDAVLSYKHALELEPGSRVATEGLAQARDICAENA
jgi:tetratricopeptide (TPR) repeat protein